MEVKSRQFFTYSYCSANITGVLRVVLIDIDPPSSHWSVVKKSRRVDYCEIVDIDTVKLKRCPIIYITVILTKSSLKILCYKFHKI